MGWCAPCRDDETAAGAAPAVELVRSLAEAPTRGAVVRGALAESARTWSGAVAEAATRQILTFYPASSGAMTAFSRQKCHESRAAIKPSVEFLRWLGESRGAPGWQLRGDLKLRPGEVDAILGPALADALTVTSTSLWAGAGGSRTPLHKDDVHALVYQAVGSKRFFLSSRSSVADAVAAARLPRGVLEAGNTEDHCVDGSIDDVFGLSEAAPTLVAGELAVLREGDCLVLPAGLYHDVECDAGSPASMSLTVRFEFAGDSDGAAEAPPERAPEKAAGGKKDLHKFLMKLALKKAMRDAKARPPAPPDEEVRQ